MRTITLSHARGDRGINIWQIPIVVALSTLTDCCNWLKDMLIDHQPGLHWADSITVWHMPGYSLFHLMFSQDAVPLIVLNIAIRNIANCTQGINDTELLPVATAGLLERQWVGNKAVIQNLKESRDANQCEHDQAAILQDEDPQIANLARLQNSMIE